MLFHKVVLYYKVHIIFYIKVSFVVSYGMFFLSGGLRVHPCSCLPYHWNFIIIPPVAVVGFGGKMVVVVLVSNVTVRLFHKTGL